MPVQLLIGLGAGLAAAIMLFSAAQGPSVTGFLLSLTSMLPIFLAGLGWGIGAAGIAALTGAVVFAIIGSPVAGGIWLVSQALPVLLLCHYAYLNRTLPAASAAATAQSTTTSNVTASANHIVEWYPVGNLVALAGFIGGVLASLLLSLMGTTVAAIHDNIKNILTSMIAKFPALAPQKISDQDMDQIVNVLVYAWPASFGIACVLILLFNFWLAARITRASGRLARPWPDLAAIKIPPIAALGITISMLATYLSGMAGLYATAFAGAFMVVYICLGLAIIHYITRGNPYRGFILWAVYLLTFFFNTYVMLALAIIGIAEPISPLKRRLPPPSGPSDPRSQGPGPPPPPSNTNS